MYPYSATRSMTRFSTLYRTKYDTKGNCPSFPNPPYSTGCWMGPAENVGSHFSASIMDSTTAEFTISEEYVAASPSVDMQARAAESAKKRMNTVICRSICSNRLNVIDFLMQIIT